MHSGLGPAVGIGIWAWLGWDGCSGMATAVLWMVGPPQCRRRRRGRRRWATMAWERRIVDGLVGSLEPTPRRHPPQLLRFADGSPRADSTHFHADSTTRIPHTSTRFRTVSTHFHTDSTRIPHGFHTDSTHFTSPRNIETIAANLSNYVKSQESSACVRVCVRAPTLGIAPPERATWRSGWGGHLTAHSAAASRAEVR